MLTLKKMNAEYAQIIERKSNQFGRGYYYAAYRPGDMSCICSASTLSELKVELDAWLKEEKIMDEAFDAMEAEGEAYLNSKKGKLLRSLGLL